MRDLLIQTINVFFYRFLYYLLLIRVLLSWLPSLRQGFIGDIVYSLSEPILRPIHNMVDRSPIGGTIIDFSPIIALFLMSIIAEALKGIVLLVF